MSVVPTFDLGQGVGCRHLLVVDKVVIFLGVIVFTSDHIHREPQCFVYVALLILEWEKLVFKNSSMHSIRSLELFFSYFHIYIFFFSPSPLYILVYKKKMKLGGGDPDRPTSRFFVSPEDRKHFFYVRVALPTRRNSRTALRVAAARLRSCAESSEKSNSKSPSCVKFLTQPITLQRCVLIGQNTIPKAVLPT